MSERKRLLFSIARLIRDYRAGEIPSPTPDHVDRWISQFDASVQEALLAELDFVLRSAYLNKTTVSTCLSQYMGNPKLAGQRPKEFWATANFFCNQMHGRSQVELLALFGENLRQKYGLNLATCGGGNVYIYLDDAIFSGSRLLQDLSRWVRNKAPQKAIVHILVMVTYQTGEDWALGKLNEAAHAVGKHIDFSVSCSLRLENRMPFRHKSDVLWPTEPLPEDALLSSYLSQQHDYPFRARPCSGPSQFGLFSSEQGRGLLERELLLAGVRIRAMSNSPQPKLRPLGYSPFGLGFGALTVTYRNCPNNCPLAFWWGDPAQPQASPLAHWYPLFPRKTYDAPVVSHEHPIDARHEVKLPF